MSMNSVHGQKPRIIPAGEFKQRCLALLDQVEQTGVPIVVTKRGRPVARVVPTEEPANPLKGSIRILTDNEEDLFSVGEVWDVERDR
jgi:prevent-host-death family protein